MAENSLCFGVCTLMCLVAAFILSRELHPEAQEKEVAYAVIGILSARGNFNQRNALRNTWLKYLNWKNLSTERVLHRFIIGSRGCEIPVQDRKSNFSCEWDPIILARFDDKILAYSVKDDEQIRKVSGPLGLDFEVNQPIVIEQLAVIAQNATENTDLRVSIFDRISMKEIVHAHFDSKNKNTMKSNFWFQGVDQVMLPKGFKGSLVVDGFPGAIFVTSGPCLINDGGGLISFVKATRQGVMSTYFPEEITARESFCHFLQGSFVYSRFGKEDELHPNITRQVEQRRSRYETQQQHLMLENEKLKLESSEYGDLLFVDVIDHYRNLPKKLLKFYSWVVKNYRFEFTIKTDDDCFLNIPGIFKGIREFKLDANDSVWYSQFRFSWQLDHFGKWAENIYSSPIYPAFACGSGNILSRYLVQWLAQNEKWFNLFQGEDVSVGIWLSAVAPRLIHDRRWSCFKNCHKDVLSLPDNSPEELTSLFNNSIHCQNPCSCDS